MIGLHSFKLKTIIVRNMHYTREIEIVWVGFKSIKNYNTGFTIHSENSILLVA